MVIRPCLFCFPQDENMADMKKVIIVHYGEIALKGKNRIFFENKLIKNMKLALRHVEIDAVHRLRGRIIIAFKADVRAEEVIPCLQKVFGIVHFSIGVAVEKDLQRFKEVAWQLMQEQPFQSFRIATKRAQKEFPLTSVEINREVGAYVYARCQKKVDLKKPDLACYIEITEKGAFIYTEKIPGLRGMPSGVSEKAVSLLSSGIDSPVASYLMIKRGVRLVFAHFHSQPYTNVASQENTEKLVQLLTQYQFHSKVYFVPFIDIQKEIMAKAPSELRVLLYRRYMIRLSERIARQEGAVALVTGENVAQVASQTLSNIRVVGEVTALPILRPLAGFDKEEIIQLAHTIDTFAISTAPHEDCCSLFVPQNPATKARPADLHRAERLLDMEALLDEAMQHAETKTFSVLEQAPAQ